MPATTTAAAVRSERGALQLRPLGPLLCWAIVYADIGTSIYYVPGVLYRDVGTTAAGFVLATGIAFIFLAQKYAEIAGRYPGGGGVVSVAGDAFGARVGAVGGMLILVDYFLTAAISAVSGFTYLASFLPALDGLEALLAVGGLALLGLLNWIGIRESASASALVAVAAFAVLMILLGTTTLRADAQDWAMVGDSFRAVGELPLAAAVVGFAGAWLAFSGLESLAQISPAMAAPRPRTAMIAMGLVGLTVLATSPLLTAFATTTLDPSRVDPDALQSELGLAVGGPLLRVAVVITASSLLVFAANTAIVGAYHIFGALADGGFLPRGFLARSPRFGTPGIAIAVAAVTPACIIGLTGGDIHTLADLYAFGLLGAFVLSSVALDRIRIAEGKTGWLFALGLLTSVLVVVAFATNLVSKPQATLFGGSLTLAMLAYGLVHRRALGRRPGSPIVDLEEAERQAAARPAAAQILTLAEALDLGATYAPRTLICLRGPNERLLEEAAAHLAGRKEWSAALLFVDEVPGLFVPRDTEPTREARECLLDAAAFLEVRGVTAVPIWRIAQDAGEAIANAADRLAVDAIFVGTSQRGALWRMLRGSVLARLVQRVPIDRRLVIVG